MALNAPIQGSAADIIKVAMLGVDAALRDRGCAPGCCSRCTTSWSSRSRRASSTPLRELVERRPWAAAFELTGPARRVDRHRPQLGGRGALRHPRLAA